MKRAESGALASRILLRCIRATGFGDAGAEGRHGCARAPAGFRADTWVRPYRHRSLWPSPLKEGAPPERADRIAQLLGACHDDRRLQVAGAPGFP
jgi:hypothetical protein